MMLVIDDLLSEKEVAVVRDTLTRAHFVSGTTTGKSSLKNNLQAERSHPEIQQATRAITGKMLARHEFTAFAIPRNLTLMFNRYDVGMRYRDHIDAALMGPSQREALRADLSFTVFLTDPQSYEGGEFILQTPYGTQRIKRPAGSLICYPSTMLHRVEEISAGSRWAAVGWIQSFVRDPAQRALCHQMDQLRHRLVAELPAESDIPEEFGTIHQNLLRMWAEL